MFEFQVGTSHLRSLYFKMLGQVFIQRLLFGKLSSCAFFRNFILTNFQVMFSDFFLDFSVRVCFMQFCMECVCKSTILIMLVFFKSPFLFLYFPVIYSVSLMFWYVAAAWVGFWIWFWTSRLSWLEQAVVCQF